MRKIGDCPLLLSFHHYDALGSTSALTDSGEATEVEYLYKAFGEQSILSGSSDNPFTWIGQLGYYRQSDPSDYWVRARIMNPTAGRWVSRDPRATDIHLIVEQEPAITNNCYLIGINNPTVDIDPSGLQPFNSSNDAYSWVMNRMKLELKAAKHDLFGPYRTYEAWAENLAKTHGRWWVVQMLRPKTWSETFFQDKRTFDFYKCYFWDCLLPGELISEAAGYVVYYRRWYIARGIWAFRQPWRSRAFATSKIVVPRTMSKIAEGIPVFKAATFAIDTIRCYIGCTMSWPMQG